MLATVFASVFAAAAALILATGIGVLSLWTLLRA